MSAPLSNPFNSDRVRPGAVDYIFPDGQSVEFLIVCLQKNRWRGEIVGPHGSGKSTLVQLLLPELNWLGLDVTLGMFQGGQQRWSQMPAVTAKGHIVVIDGFEQLPAWARVRWKLTTWLRGQGLIVTAHRPMGLPVLHRTTVTNDVAACIVEQLLDGADAELSRSQIARTLQSHNGNMRDTLFDLYDAYEARPHS